MFKTFNQYSDITHNTYNIASLSSCNRFRYKLGTFKGRIRNLLLLRRQSTVQYLLEICRIWNPMHGPIPILVLYSPQYNGDPPYDFF